MKETLLFPEKISVPTCLGGEGFYTMEFSHYDTVPAGTAQPIIAAAMTRQVAEEE